MSTWYAKSLNEYIHIIECILGQQEADEKSVLWFRGLEQTDISYHLEPSIYRYISSGKETNHMNGQKTYGTLRLKEEYRYQHFVARNYDKVQNMPESMIEWQEVMQHYFSKTRLMDWSESAIVALNFALEAYVNPTEDREVLYKRRHNMPVIWVLNPVRLNKVVYNCFVSNDQLIKSAMDGIAAIDDIIKEIKDQPQWYFELENNGGNIGVNGLLSLSGLEFLRTSYGGALKQAVENRSFNPFFYLLLRYYSDGLGVKVGDLTPLAIIHPHHSARIHEQKGAFTVFPYYYDDTVAERKATPFAMEHMPLCKSCLEKIMIMDAAAMAKQLKGIGVKRSHIYPEMEVVTKDFENMK